MPTIFHNRQDVLAFYGAADEKGLDRRVYKNTECGAWAKFDTWGDVTGSHTEVWSAHLSRGINGIHVVSARREPDGETVHKVEDLPEKIREYLALGTNSTLTTISEAEFDTLSSIRDQRVTDLSALHKLVTFRVTFVHTEPREGLVIGSIIEGSDAEVCPARLAFPFDSDELDAAIKQVEDEADTLWKEANGGGELELMAVEPDMDEACKLFVKWMQQKYDSAPEDVTFMVGRAVDELSNDK